MATEVPDASHEDAPSPASASPSATHESAASRPEIPPTEEPTGLWARISRHKVVEWTLAYIAFGYASLHGVEMLGEAFEWPAVVSRLTVIVLLVGLPIAVTLAWFHGHRAQHRVSRLELSVLVLLLIAGGTVLWLYPRGGHERSAIGARESAEAAAFVPPAHSVAVLPFTNLSGDPQQEYFSDGISEELINALVHIDELEVAARTSSFSFKGKDADVATIARKLNVGAVLEGSIRRSGNTVRITAQLINARDGFHLWSQTYDRDLKDVLALQTAIATAVAEQLQVKLLGDEATRIEVGGTNNPDAYDAYLHGLQILATTDQESEGRAALAAFDQAILLDPNYAAAHAKRAHALGVIVLRTKSSESREGLREQARAAAERAVALAPGLASAHVALWWVRAILLFDFVGAAPEMERSLALAPGDAQVQNNAGILQCILGHLDAAVAAHRRAAVLDPLNYRYRLNLAIVLNYARRFEEAIVAARQAKAINPQGANIESRIADDYLGLGRPDLARQICEHPSELFEEGARHGCLAVAYHALAKVKEAETELASAKALDGDSAAFNYAETYAQWGDKASALRWLAVAERLHDPQLPWLKVDWMLDPIRNEPEFRALERRMKFPD